MGEPHQSLGRSCFVTVGTTSFDDMIEEVCSPSVCRALRDRGIRELVFQVGRGQARPHELLYAEARAWFTLSSFDFAPSLDAHMRAADLIISHGGAGSIMEGLGMNKPLVVVINESLMENHQWELAGALARRKHLIAVNCAGVADAVKSLQTEELLPYPKPDQTIFPALVRDMCRFGHYGPG